MKEKKKVILQNKLNEQNKKIKEFRNILFSLNAKSCIDKIYFAEQLTDLKNEYNKIFGVEK